MLRDQCDVATARRHHNRFSEAPSEQDGGDAGRVEIVSIDEVEVIASLEEPAQCWGARRGEQERGGAHTDLGHQRIVWVQYLDVSMYLAPRRPRPCSVSTKPRMGRREPRDRRHHHGL